MDSHTAKIQFERELMQATGLTRTQVRRGLKEAVEARTNLTNVLKGVASIPQPKPPIQIQSDVIETQKSGFVAPPATITGVDAITPAAAIGQTTDIYVTVAENGQFALATARVNLTDLTYVTGFSA